MKRRIARFGLPLCLALVNSPSPAQMPAVPVETGQRIDVGAGPTALAYAPDGTRLYVTLNDENAVAVVDPIAGKVLARHVHALPVTQDGCQHNFCRGIGATGIAVDSAGSMLYIASWEQDALSAVDPVTGETKWSSPAGRFPRLVVLPRGSLSAWTFSGVSNELTRIALGDGKVQATVSLGGEPVHQSFGRPVGLTSSNDGKRIHATGESGIQRINVVTGKAIDSVEQGAAWAIEMDRNGKLVAQYADGFVEYDEQKLQAQRAFLYCRDLESFGFALSADGKLIAVSSHRDALVLVASRDDGLLTHVFSAGKWPVELAFSPDSTQLAVLDGDMATPALALFDVRERKDMAPYLERIGELFCQPEPQRRWR